MNRKNKVLTTGGILTFILLSLACGGEKQTIITGKIINSQNDSFSIGQHKVELSQAGDFQHSILLVEPAYILIDFGKELELYVRPGDQLNLQIDAKAGLKSAETSGGPEEINRFLIDLAVDSVESGEYFNKNFSKIVDLDEKSYVERVNSLWRPFEEKVEAFLETVKLKDLYFSKTLRASLLYSKASILLRYPDWHRSLTGDHAYHPSEEYASFLRELDLNDPELIEQREYRSFLDDYLSYKTGELLRDRSLFVDLNYRPFRVELKVILESFSDPLIRSEMLYPFIVKLLGEYSHKGIEDFMQAFEENCTDPGYVTEVERLIAADTAIRDGCDIVTYKKAGDYELDVYIWKPADLKPGDKRPAVAFFHGGGWECGKPEWGQMQGQHFAAAGYVSFSFEYRLKTQHGATPIEGLADTKSAIRWIRQHAEEFGIDPNRVVGSGYSAGGHLVMCTAMVEGYDEPYEDLSIDSAVDAMLLWVTPAKVFPGWFEQMLDGKGSLNDFDPDQLLRPDLSPMVFFQGTADDTVPAWSVQAFVKKSQAIGNRCDLHLYEGQTHLNWGKNADDVLKKMDIFLESIGYFKSKI